MTNVDAVIVHEMTTLARNGATPAQIMRTLVGRLSPADTHTVNLIRYARAAFGLSLAQAKPIAGWAPNGSGELKDARLDELLTADILANRDHWAP
jgi:hypothetical protein